MTNDELLFEGWLSNKLKNKNRKLTLDEYKKYYEKNHIEECKKLVLYAKKLLTSEFKEFSKYFKIASLKKVSDDEIFALDILDWKLDEEEDSFNTLYSKIFKSLQQNLSDKKLFKIEELGDNDSGTIAVQLNTKEAIKRLPKQESTLNEENNSPLHDIGLDKFPFERISFNDLEDTLQENELLFEGWLSNKLKKKTELKEKFSIISNDIYEKYFQKEHYEFYKDLKSGAKELINTKYSELKKYISFIKKEKYDEFNNEDFHYILFKLDWERICNLPPEEFTHIEALLKDLVYDLEYSLNKDRKLYSISDEEIWTYYLEVKEAKKRLVKNKVQIQENELLFEGWISDKLKASKEKKDQKKREKEEAEKNSRKPDQQILTYNEFLKIHKIFLKAVKDANSAVRKAYPGIKHTLTPEEIKKCQDITLKKSDKYGEYYEYNKSVIVIDIRNNFKTLEKYTYKDKTHEDLVEYIEEDVLDKYATESKGFERFSYTFISHEDSNDTLWTGFDDDSEYLKINFSCYIHKDEVPQNLQENIESELLYEGWLSDKLEKRKQKKELKKKFSKMTDEIYEKYFQKEHYMLYKELKAKVKKLIDLEYSEYKKYIEYPKKETVDDEEYSYVLFNVNWDKIKHLDEEEQERIEGALEYYLISDIYQIAKIKGGIYHISKSTDPCVFYLHQSNALRSLKTQQISENELLFESWLNSKKKSKRQIKREETFNKYYEGVSKFIIERYPAIKKMIDETLQNSEYKNLKNLFIWENQNELKVNKYECKILTLKNTNNTDLIDRFINNVNDDNYIPYIKVIRREDNIYIEYTQKLLNVF